MKIAFVGGGHIAAAMIAGMRAGERAADDIIVADRNSEKRRKLREKFGVPVADSQNALPKNADILILAVKPAAMRAACRKITQRRAIVVSVAAGVSLAKIAAWIPFAPRHLARAMPNTPLAAAAGMTVCHAVAPEIHAQVGALFASAGKVLWVKDEAMLDAATAVSGCGPAYLYYLAEAMEEAATAAGFSAAEARLLVSQTLRGGGEMLCARDESAAELRRAVAVKGGATERAIAAIESQNWKKIVHDAVRAAQNRAEEIAEELARQPADE
ncbi:MAG: pyrroline-5-carboxylate reductase [Gammaproteobacteria bacterium]